MLNICEIEPAPTWSTAVFLHTPTTLNETMCKQRALSGKPGPAYESCNLGRLYCTSIECCEIAIPKAGETRH